MLVDTHCHLADAAFDPDREAVVRRAATAGVGHVIIIADSLETTRRATELAHALDLSATAGVHPHIASSWNSDTAARIEAALHDPAVVAVGETGLDYHYDHSPREDQRRAFDAQLALAARLGKPVVVHAREADDDVAGALTAFGSSLPAVVLHSFSSGSRVFEAALGIGAYVSFSGMVTFRNWRLGTCVAECPGDRILVETDAPYLAPVPHRGRRNEPAFVEAIAARVAELRGEPLDVFAARSTENAGRCFGSRIHHLQHQPT
jgi:TatD DNase family protein